MKSNWFKNNWLILVTGLVIGIAALVLGVHGNPGNMGFCSACFGTGYPTPIPTGQKDRFEEKISTDIPEKESEESYDKFLRVE